MIGKRVKEARKAKGLKTQLELAELLNTSRDRIANIESDRIAIDDMFVAFFCEKLNINEDWLLTGEGEMFAERSREEIMATYAAELTIGDDEFIQNFVKKYMQLSPENKKLFRSLFKE